MASWRSGYAEDCKSLHPGSIPGEASISSKMIYDPDMSLMWLDQRNLVESGYSRPSGGAVAASPFR